MLSEYEVFEYLNLMAYENPGKAFAICRHAKELLENLTDTRETILLKLAMLCV